MLSRAISRKLRSSKQRLKPTNRLTVNHITSVELDNGSWPAPQMGGFVSGRSLCCRDARSVTGSKAFCLLAGVDECGMETALVIRPAVG